MRLIHTSDWHLGHTLREQPRDEEHQAFLTWLLAELVRTHADALLIAGDVFDQAHPTSAAQRRFYHFLAQARAQQPDLDIVVIGGNHDSAARLDAPRPLFEVAGVRMVGGLPRTADRSLNLEHILVPLHDRTGAIAAWVVAMPFLRPADLPRVEAANVDPLVAGVAALYDQALAAARASREPDQALIAMGHCYLADTRRSEGSERKILGGNQHALPASIFPSDVAYVALGHLHLAQEVGAPHIRYSGSPIPLSLAEAEYPHQVVQVDLEGDRLVAATALPVPRQVAMIRVPEGPLGQVLASLLALPPLDPHMPHWQRPFLEVTIALEGSAADVRQKVEAVLQDKAARLVSLRLNALREDSSLADAMPTTDLQSLDPEAVLVRRWAARHGGTPPADLLNTFHELLAAVQAEET